MKTPVMADKKFHPRGRFFFSFLLRISEPNDKSQRLTWTWHEVDGIRNFFQSSSAIYRNRTRGDFFLCWINIHAPVNLSRSTFFFLPTVTGSAFPFLFARAPSSLFLKVAYVIPQHYLLSSICLWLSISRAIHSRSVTFLAGKIDRPETKINSLIRLNS